MSDNKELAKEIAKKALNTNTVIDASKEKEILEVLDITEELMDSASGGTISSIVEPLSKIRENEELKKKLGLETELSEKEIDKAVKAAKDLEEFIGENFNSKDNDINSDYLVSIAGKIDRTRLQIQIIEKQEEGVVLDPNDPIYKHLFVSKGDVLAKDAIDKKALERYIVTMEESLYMKELIEDIKRPTVFVDKSKYKSARNKVYKKIYGNDLADKTPKELALMKHYINFDYILAVLDSINSSEESKVYNMIFVYALIKYVSENYLSPKQSYINLVTDNIAYIGRYPNLTQNSLVIDSLEKVFTKLFPEALD